MGCLNEPETHYAVRRLNPYQGVIQVIETASGRAISFDSFRWELQIESVRPDDLWGAVSQGEPVVKFLRFGTWSKRSGLRKVPAHPLLDLRSMHREAEKLIGVLEAGNHPLPFPLNDRYELWLLDEKELLPLALLSSSILPPDTSGRANAIWKCADKTQGDFSSPELDEARPAHPKDTSPHPHINALERLVRIEAGHGVSQWFERLPGGNGKGLAHPHCQEIANRELDKELFPELLLREQWSDCYDQVLVADYLAWLSPRLLELQNISRSKRKILEQHASVYALEVDANWRLYPEIIDTSFLDTARVEARLRSAHS